MSIDVLKKFDNYIETMLEKISLKQLLLTLILLFVGVVISVFAISAYHTMYQTIYKEREIKIKDADNFVIKILEYQNSLVEKHKKTLQQAQKESIEMIKKVRLENEDYIWIDNYSGINIYHPMPEHSRNLIVDTQIGKIVKKQGEGYLSYRWEKIGKFNQMKYKKISFVKGFKKWNWIVGTGTYIDDIKYKVITSMLSGILPVFIFFAFIIILSRYIILKSVVNPINNLAEVSSKLANDDFSVTLPVVESNTELGKLCKIINKFAELFEKEKKATEREKGLRNIIEQIRSSLDIEETLSYICEEIAKIFNVQRSAIATFSPSGSTDRYLIRKEYKSVPGLKGFTYGEKFSDTARYWENNLLQTDQVLAFKNIAESDAPDYFKKTYEDMGIKSVIGTAIRKGEKVWGTLVLSEYNNLRDWSDDEKELLKTIASEVYIAITQAEIFEHERRTAQRERILRDITNKIRSSLDYEDTLYYICEETAKLFKVQRSTIVSYPSSGDISTFKLEKEYKTEPYILGLSQVEDFSKIAEYLWTTLKDNPSITIDNIEESDTPEEFKQTYLSIGAKSIMITVIKEEDKIWGSLVLTEYNKLKHWSEEDKTLVTTIADQVLLAIKQAKLYEKQKLMAEREKISRNIIEILRSSIDKAIIKKLFVRNIGKFFDADRVLFSEYDEMQKKYLPVEKGSEYLSSPSEKSFVGYDWSNPEASEFIQPLLEKREINIFNWDEYINKNKKGQDFINFFESANIQSSYNFPVLYQQSIMGFFCIDFMGKVHELSDEDINRIRSICTQAGIALYHADLYEKAQKCYISQENTLTKFSDEIKDPIRNILDKSSVLHDNEFERSVQIDYLNSIIISCNKLLDLTKDIL